MSECDVKECGNHSYALGWCHMHYRRYKRHGNPITVTRREYGQGTKDSSGYITIRNANKKRRAHVIIAEKALGRDLPNGAEVHHVDGNKTNNDNSNLIICPNRAYHRLLHLRTAALNACGNPQWRLCIFRHKHDAIDRMIVHCESYAHIECRRLKARQAYAAVKLTESA